jgi:dTDP-4-amino-4,6-dideoxygalactose transaminase
MANPPPILFGQPLMPDRQAFDHLVDDIFAARWLTNGGALHDRLESDLGQLFGGDAVLVSSGTMALMMALRLGNLRPGGQVITTPLSFAASVQAIDWCGLRPVFADIEPGRPTLCAKAVERAITPDTVAILAVHFMGLACDVAALQDVARRHDLWLVFDAAQAPDVQQGDRPLALVGDATALSLHATKLLNTAEGGVVLARHPDHPARLRRMRNFGLEDGRMTDIGTNAKLSALHAAWGLAVLPRLKAELQARAALRQAYRAALIGAPHLTILDPRPGTSESQLYFTLALPPHLGRRLRATLQTAGIHPRAPFAPLCGPGTNHPDAAACPNAMAIADRYLSLPLHGDITPDTVQRIATMIHAQLADERAAPDAGH